MQCDKCFLAFPEKYPPAIIIRFQDKLLHDKIVKEACEIGLSIEDYIISKIK